MFNMFKGDDDEKEENPSKEPQIVAPIGELIDKDEVAFNLPFQTACSLIIASQIRRRRLAKMTITQVVNQSTSSVKHSPVQQNTPSKAADQHISGISNPLLSNEKKTNKIHPVESPKKSAPQDLSYAPLTPTSQDARMLNLSLEHILHATLRPDIHDSLLSFLGDLLDMRGQLINVSNMSDVVCSKLNSRGDILNCVSFLVGAYKRLISKESASSGNIGNDLMR